MAADQENGEREHLLGPDEEFGSDLEAYLKANGVEASGNGAHFSTEDLTPPKGTIEWLKKVGSIANSLPGKALMSVGTLATMTSMALSNQSEYKGIVSMWNSQLSGYWTSQRGLEDIKLMYEESVRNNRTMSGAEVLEAAVKHLTPVININDQLFNSTQSSPEAASLADNQALKYLEQSSAHLSSAQTYMKASLATLAVPMVLAAGMGVYYIYRNRTKTKQPDIESSPGLRSAHQADSIPLNDIGIVDTRRAMEATVIGKATVLLVSKYNNDDKLLNVQMVDSFSKPEKNLGSFIANKEFFKKEFPLTESMSFEETQRFGISRKGNQFILAKYGVHKSNEGTQSQGHEGHRGMS